MTANDQEFLKKLLATFRVEAEEHISVISSRLVELETSPERRMAIVETVFREAHSLKGAARSVNLAKIERVCQSLETLFSRLKTQEEPFSPELFDRLHRMVDSLSRFLSDTGAETSVPTDLQFPDTQRQSEAQAGPFIAKPGLSAPLPAGRRLAESASVAQRFAPDERPGLPDTVRVSTLKLDSLLREAEELISTKASGAHLLNQLREINTRVALWEKEWRKVRPQARALQLFFEKESKVNGQVRLSNGQENALPRISSIVAFLDWNERALQSLRSQLAGVTKNLESDQRTLDRRVGDLVSDAKRLSMLPFSSLLEAFPKLVRDLCRDCGKDAELTIEGGDIEADRRILEEMKDPLMHLVRNCIDHGIEQPVERERRKKASRANITIAVSPRSGGRLEIAVSDDGAGVDADKVRAAGRKLGLVSGDEAQKMDNRETLSLVFQSGLSTSPIITEVSGRGLGLAIVREKAEKVGGTVSLETQPGVGTTFRLVLPLTLATFRGILVRLGENLFVLPTMYVQRVLRVGRDEIKSAENREIVQLNGRAGSLVRLGNVLGIADRTPAPDPKRKVPIVVLVWAGEQIALLVDEILGDQEVLVKSLGKQLPRVRNISGATILGSGNVVAVLNVVDLVRSAAGATGSPVPQVAEKPKSILVAEDSITARTLLKNILESAGYDVNTAIDGAEALAALRGKDFDLLVSDVEMPKMNGFDLTAKVRADRKFSELPVVLVTALESRQDRERGVDVGADAYIVKSSFDQSNLLEVVRRLI